MKQTINLGAYGWRHGHWSGTFYPDDLPMADDEDWRLAYYSNEFNAVMVPADYWQDTQNVDCEDWLDSVHTDFQFFVECRASMLDSLAPADLAAALKKLSPQLSALVFPDDAPPMPASVKQTFVELAASLQLALIDVATDATRFLLLEDDLSGLRAIRATVEQFAAQRDDVLAESTIIVNHAQLQAGDLSKFRSMLEIMGY